MRRLSLLLILLMAFSAVQAQRISHTYNNVSLSEALLQLNNEQSDYAINFLYNELEDFRITATIKNKKLPDAIQQMIGFYPVRMTVIPDDHEIYLECTHKTDRHLTGTIVDEQGQPVAYANVAILNPTDSTLLSGGVSNESGYFAIPYEQPTVLARISYVGYKTVYRLCNQPEVGTIRMQPETQAIRGVVVKGQTPILRREAGAIIFDTRNITGAINATDLLRYAPGVLLTDDDITLFGTSGIIFYVNGKEQRMGQKEMLQMLKSYPASDVEKIEIIQSPGAKHSAAGNAGIINIILKKKGNDYIGGSIGYAHTQYEEHGDEANANIIYNKGKVSTSLNVAGTWDNTRYCETNTIQFDDYVRYNTDNGHIKKENYSARWQIDYNASDRLSFGAYAMMADGERCLDVDGEYIYGGYSLLGMNKLNTCTDRQEDTKNYALNVNASQKLNNKGAKVDYNLDYYRMKMGDNRTASNVHALAGARPGDLFYQNDIAQTVDNYSVKVDACVGDIKFGSHYTQTRSNRQLDYTVTELDLQQDAFIYDERVLAAYAEWGKRFGNKWSMNVGGRYEYTWTKGDNQSVGSVSHTDYGKFFPSLWIGYNPSQNHSFNWSLSNRITRPNVINVNPSVVWNDTYHNSKGNPDLQPSYFYKAMMGYTYKGVLSFDLYYTYEPDRASAISRMGDAQVTTTTWDNVVDAHSFGINSFYYFARLKWMTAILMQGIGYSKTTSTSQWAQPSIESLSYVGVLQTSLFLDHERKWIVNLNFTYNSREKDVTKVLNSRYMMDLGLQHTFWKDRLTFGLTCRNLLASRIKGTEYLGGSTMDFNNKFNYRQLRLTLTYNWGARLRQSHRQYQSDEVKERVVNDF